MGEKKEYTLKLTEDDLYWIQNLLRQYIDSNESNFHQKLMVTRTLMKTLLTANCEPIIDGQDMRVIREILALVGADNSCLSSIPKRNPRGKSKISSPSPSGK